MADWFESWFDSTYYHILYKNRNASEAENFLNNLTGYLTIPKNSRILDLACGKGRHAVYLNSLGFDVTGVDLSPNSISYAQKFTNDHLRFRVQDMRCPLENQQFDLILNLFTSFGYFEKLEDNLAVLHAAHQMLKPGGLLVIDFMNAVKVEHDLVNHEEKTCEQVNFTINKVIKNGCIYKTIRFEDSGKVHEFTERVQLLKRDDFEQMLQKTGFHLQAVFGDYNLGTFAPAVSERLVLVAVKK